MGKHDSRTPRTSRKLKRDETFDQQLLCDELLEQLKNAKDASGKSLSELFMRVPSRRTDPEYYNVVKDPIDLTRINQRLRGDEYSNFDDFCKDVDLVLSNAQLYYKPDTEEYKNAMDLQKFYQDSKHRLLNQTPAGSNEPTPSPVPTDKTMPPVASNPDEPRLEAIVAALLTLTDKTGRLIAPPFRVLASREELPEYYEAISNPIDLKIIARKIRNGEYSTWTLFDEDIQLLVNNCKTFNEPGSQIYKDAERLFAQYEQKRPEFSAASFNVSKHKLTENKKQIDLLLDQHKAEDLGLVEDADEEPETEKDPSPYWVLYWAVRNLEDGTLSEPFLELVNKDFYPDYYEEIKNPMSLYVVNNRLKTNFYKKFQDLVDDLLLICYNSRCYNLDSSDYYNFAVKLENFISKKAKELDPSIVIRIAEVPAEDGDENVQQLLKSKDKVPKKRQRVSIGESDDTASEISVSRPPVKRRKAEFKEFGSGVVSPTRKHPQGRKSIEEHRIIYKNKLLKIWKTVVEHNERGIQIASPLMFLPDPNIFPDYYKKIQNPMDLNTIKSKIEQEIYSSSEEFKNDFLTIFNNVRSLYPFNDPLVLDCGILQSVLEKILDQISHGEMMRLPVRKDRSYRPRHQHMSTSPARNMACTMATPISESKLRVRSSIQKKATNDEYSKMKAIYDAILQFENTDGRILSQAFVKLPTKEEYPEYYEKIKKPMDLNRLGSRINSGQYEDLRSMLFDLKLVFDNACAFNDPNSRIYKDALILQKEVLSLRNQYVQDEFYVQAEVKLLLINLLVSVTTYTNTDGRCLSESLEDLPKYLKKGNVPEEEYPFSLDEIKYNLDKGRYRRLDRFQDDLFYLFTKVREYMPMDGEVFQDSIELQKHFIEKRDELCKSVLITPAKFYNNGVLEQEVEKIIKTRKLKEKQEKNDQEEESMEIDQLNNSGEGTEEILENVEYEGVTYYPEEYVYIASAEDDAPPDAPKHIMRIEKIMKDSEGVKVIRGFWCYKPRETYHLATRLFFPNEVFLTVFKNTVTVDRLRGKCCVMFVDDYFKSKPVDFEDEDVYVCESRYLGKRQHFKKLTVWPYPEEQEKLKVVERTEALKVVKVRSELADGSEGESRASSEKPKNEENSDSISDMISERVKNLPRILDIHREEVKDTKIQGEEGCTYYEQMVHNGIWYRRGDGVLAFKESAGHCDVYRIDKMWRTENGEAFISGPFFARPTEIKHDFSTATFYKKEVIGVEQPDVTVSMNRVQARCAILTTKAYETCRPTEFPECDVFVVERRVMGEMFPEKCSCSLMSKGYENNKEHNASPNAPPMDLEYAKALKRLREYKQSLDVPEDEIYYFKTPLEMEKELSPIIASSETTLSVDQEIENESNVDPSETSQNVETQSKWLASQPKLNAKSKSGYILFSAEVRKRIMSENPEAGFGEVSRIVGLEWKKLNDEQKRQYEVRATFIAEERAKNDLLTPSSKLLQPGQIRVYLCRWQSCDYTFDSQEGLYEHVKTSHTSQIVDGENQFVCLWNSCLKYRKEGKPFPSLPRLHRHIKEKHMPSSNKAMFPNQRNKHYFVYYPPDENATSSSSKEAPSGTFVNHPFGNAPSTIVHCVTATPLEEMSTVTTATPRTTYVQGVINDGTPHRTVKVVNYNPNQTQFVQQLPNGAVPVQYVTVGGQSVYQAVVVNQTPGQQPVQVYHHAPGTIVQQQYYQQVPQTSGTQTITVNGVTQHSQISQPYGGHPAPGSVHVQHGATVHVSHPYQPQSSQSQPQPAPAVDPRQVITRAPEPIFNQIPESLTSTRVLHSHVYKKYLENMATTKQRYLSRWDKTLGPSNNAPITSDKLPIVKQAAKRKVTDDEIARSLYLLRDQLLESTCLIRRQPEIHL